MIGETDNSLTDRARALWFLKPYSSVIKDIELPALDSSSLKIQTLYSSISPGTERLVFQGLVPIASQDYMAVPYMEGDFSFPIKYGYSLVGEVIEGNDDYSGKLVHVMHPHQDKIVVNEKDIRLIPDTISAKRATLISNLETCINGIWDAGLQIGDKILIVGFGAIGSLLALTLKQMQFYEVDVVDIDPVKLDHARRLGISSLPHDDVSSDTYDVSFHCSASGSGLQQAIDSIAQAGKVIELSWYGSKEISLHLNTSFHIKRKRIISSQVSTIPEHQSARWNYLRRVELVKIILENREFEKLITSEIRFEDTPQHFTELSHQGNKDLSLVIQYDT